MPFCLIDYAAIAVELRDDVTRQQQGHDSRIVSRLDAFLIESKTNALQGDRTLASLYAALDSCGIQRTETQRFFHQSFVLSVLPWIYGIKDFSRYREKILFQNGIANSEKYNQFTLISTPRRWGKTTSVAVFCAAMLYTVPDAWISVYSTGTRASKALGNMVYKFVLRMEECGKLKRTKVIKKNEEELFYGGDIASDVRRMFSYPATVQVGFRFRNPHSYP
jgi:hypothetical protein